MDDELTNNESARRYELTVGGAVALAAYSLNGDTITFTHTEVPEGLEGQGVGTRLVDGALADARRRGLKVVPICSFVRRYIDTHPEARELLA